MIEVFRRQPKQIMLTALLRMPEQAPGYIVGAFIFTYGTTVLGMSRDFLLTGVITCRQSLGFLWVPSPGSCRTRIGRKNMYMFGCVFMGDLGFVYFAMLNTRMPMLIFIAMATVAHPGHDDVRPRRR